MENSDINEGNKKQHSIPKIVLIVTLLTLLSFYFGENIGEQLVSIKKSTPGKMLEIFTLKIFWGDKFSYILSGILKGIPFLTIALLLTTWKEIFNYVHTIVEFQRNNNILSLWKPTIALCSSFFMIGVTIPPLKFQEPSIIEPLKKYNLTYLSFGDFGWYKEPESNSPLAKSNSSLANFVVGFPYPAEEKKDGQFLKGVSLKKDERASHFITQLAKGLSKCNEKQDIYPIIEVVGFADRSDTKDRNKLLKAGKSEGEINNIINQLNISAANQRANGIAEIFRKNVAKGAHGNYPCICVKEWKSINKMNQALRFDGRVSGKYFQKSGSLNRRVDIRIISAGTCNENSDGQSKVNCDCEQPMFNNIK